MSTTSIRLGINPPAKPPIGDLRLLVRASRVLGLDTVMLWDHFQDFIPNAIWTEENTWMAKDLKYPHEHFEFQVLLGYLASYAGNIRLGVGVTEPLRRHPVLIAQALMTLAHVTRRAPILGLGAGERENTEPYGIPLVKQVSKLEEALQIIQMCFTSRGPFSFSGEHFQLNDAIMDLIPPDGKTPPIWIAAHGPRMMRLTGQYGDGWYPTTTFQPDDYGDRLSTIRRHARDAGRDGSQIVGSLSLPIVIAPSDDEARAILDLAVVKSIVLSYPDEVYAQHGATHPLGKGFKGFASILPEKIPEEELNAAVAAIPLELMEKIVVWGTPDRIASYLHSLGQAGLQHAVVLPMSALASKKMLNYVPRGLWSLRRKLQ